MNTGQSGENGKVKVRLIEFLPRGSLAILADRHGFSKAQISRILSGERKNDVVYLDALDMAEKEKVRRQKAKEEEDAKQEEIQQRLADLTT